MLKNDLENLELDRLENESRKLVAERKKLLAEEKKLKRETNLYPLAVIAGVVTAITAAAGASSSFDCSFHNRPTHDPKENPHEYL
ncbi:hypothetical protein [Pseudomonas koreensis]|uniref:hypothetical protein n=1 Tax=Pseudomonas koreensis TaxID=198620 RepID=UPI0032099168